MTTKTIDDQATYNWFPDGASARRDGAARAQARQGMATPRITTQCRDYLDPVTRSAQSLMPLTRAYCSLQDVPWTRLRPRASKKVWLTQL